ncbi:hypothetical protein MNBD_GAMMA01-1203 [hydrothermal vent metagenome]|uniref:Uncharacterized protein n=1 Tax=hydrothermal vent metagenome TaxID=652676 RepID=A0A3B0VIP8_9ZZZZ
MKNKTATDFKSFEFEQGKSYGVLYVMNEICKRLGITEALNRTSYGKITLLQIMARILNNGSQRAIGNWAGLNAVEEILKMKIPSLEGQERTRETRQERRQERHTLFQTLFRPKLTYFKTLKSKNIQFNR